MPVRSLNSLLIYSNNNDLPSAFFFSLRFEALESNICFASYSDTPSAIFLDIKVFLSEFHRDSSYLKSAFLSPYKSSFNCCNSLAIFQAIDPRSFL
jgi:hypothetical protein